MKTFASAEKVVLKRRQDGAFYKARREWVADIEDARDFASVEEAELFCIITNIGGVEIRQAATTHWQG